MTAQKVRRIYCSFEYDKDAQRWNTFMSQAKRHCNFFLEDQSLPSAVHELRWQREALERIRSSDVVIVLLGPDTHNAPGVRDELGLAGQARRPVVQLIPQRRAYGAVSQRVPVCAFKWKRINEMLEDPQAFVTAYIRRSG